MYCGIDCWLMIVWWLCEYKILFGVKCIVALTVDNFMAVAIRGLLRTTEQLTQ